MGAKENQPGIIGGIQIAVGIGLLFVPGGQGLGVTFIVGGSTTLIAGYAFGNDSLDLDVDIGSGPRSITRGGHLVNTRNIVSIIPILYGQFRVGGNIVYISSTGSNNRFLNLIITLSEGEVDSLVTDKDGDKIWLDDKRIQDFLVFVKENTLNEPDFTSHVDWDVTGDFDDTGGNAQYTHSTGVGTLTQVLANLNWVGEPETQYKFVYTVSGSSGSPVGAITSAFANQTVTLDLTDGTQTHIFVTNSNPQDFVISVTSIGGDAFTLDSFFLLKRVNSNTNRDLVDWEFKIGSSSQEAISIDEDFNWNHPLKHTSYLYLKIEYEVGFFTAIPEITAELKGRKIFDVRTSTTIFSTNPIIQIYDYLTNVRYGLGLSSTLLNTTSFITAANWCDTNGYVSNGALIDNSDALTNISSLLSSCRGFIFWSQGEYKVKNFDFDATVMTLDEDDIVSDSWTTNVPSLQETPNVMNVNFPDIDENYITNKLKIEQSSVVVNSEDIIETSLVLPFVVDFTQGYKLGTFNLERRAFNIIHSFVTSTKALSLEPGDMIKVTHSLIGWTEQTVRVKDISINESAEIILTIIEENSNIYNDELDISSHTKSVTTLPNPLGLPPSVTDINFVEENYIEGDNTFTRLTISFNEPVNYPFFKHAEAWISLNGGSNWTIFAKVTSDGITIERANVGQQYTVKFVSVSNMDVKELFATAASGIHTIVGLDDAPNDIINFKTTIFGNTVNFSWDNISDLDLRYYEIRYGINDPAWVETFLITRVKLNNYSLAGMKPGTHYFSIKAIDTRGNYSDNEAKTTVKIPNPLGLTDQEAGGTSDDFKTWSLAAESLSEPNFATHVDWDDTGDVDSTGGNVTYIHNTGSGVLTQTSGDMIIVGSNNVLYRFDYTIVSHSGSLSNPLVSLFGNFFENIQGNLDVSVGNHTVFFYSSSTASTSAFKLLFQSSTGGNVVMDDFSLKEVTTANMIAAESLNEPDFSTHVDWDVTGDFDDTGGNVQYTHSTGAGTLTQISVNMAISGIERRIYKFVYTVSGSSGVAVAKITTSFAETEQTLKLFNGTRVIYFFANENPGDFVISVISITVDANFVLDNLSLREIKQGMYDNVEIFNHPSHGDVLRVIHNNARKDGKYMGPKYDRSSSTQRAHWLEFTPQFEGDGGAWDELMTSVDIWEDIFSSTDTWLSFIGGSFIGNLKKTLLYSEDDSEWFSGPMFNILSIQVDSRYKQNIIEITDNGDDTYIMIDGSITLQEYG